MIVMYRGAYYVYLLARLLMTVKHISLPNNLAGRRLVPELWQHHVNAREIADAAEALLEPAAYARMKSDLEAVARMFADADTPRRVAGRVSALAGLGRAETDDSAR
jgi:lipid-A-disaccharide synthase